MERIEIKKNTLVMMTLEEAVATYEQYALDAKQEKLSETYRYYTQLAEWLRELQDRRKAPEIIRCGECRHKGTKNCVANTWATIFGYEVKDDFYCGLAERRTE